METVNIKFPEFDAKGMKAQETFNGVKFAFVRKLGKGKYELATNWSQCREVICGQAREVITNKRQKDPYTQCSGEVDFNTIRLAVFFKKTAQKKAKKEERDSRLKRYIKCSLKLLNFFEDIGHLKKSKTYAAKHNLSDNNRVYIFEGSGEWMRSQHLISLYSLLIRCGKYEEFENGIKDVKDFLKKIKTISNDYKNHCYDPGARFGKWPFSQHEDAGYLDKIGPRIVVLMKYRKQIFSKKKKIEHFQSSSFNSDGIAQLVDGNIHDKETQQRFVASCDKYEMKVISK